VFFWRQHGCVHAGSRHAKTKGTHVAGGGAVGLNDLVVGGVGVGVDGVGGVVVVEESKSV
jgi:hypothetical protein